MKKNTQVEAFKHFENEANYLPYFAYGFDMVAENMAAKLEQGSRTYACKAKLEGFELACDAKGYPTIVEKPDSAVWGMLWEGLSEAEIGELETANGVRHGSYGKVPVTVKVETANVSAQRGKYEEMAFALVSQRAPFSRKTQDVEAFGAMRDEAFALEMDAECIAQIDAILRESGCPCAQPGAEAQAHAGREIGMTREQMGKCLGYVCPKCFNDLRECTCGRCPDHLVAIDREIQPHVRLLNEKGYKTTNCCSGHAHDNFMGYIALAPHDAAIDALFDRWFSNRFKGKEELPRRAEINLPDMPATYEFYFEKRAAVIRFQARRGVSAEAMVHERPAMLASLMNWVQSLPAVQR